MTEPAGRVLVVDDSRVNRMKLSRGVEQLGCVVEEAADGREALDRLASQSFDAVLLDILMPEVDGFEVLERMKASSELRDVPVIVISAVDDMASIVRCIEMGAEDYLPKDFEPVLLRARLRAGLEKKRFRDLERAYLRQEMMLRENEKLATLGRLTAGLAHELNNPTSAVRRSAVLLHEAIGKATAARTTLAAGGLDESQAAWLEDAEQRVQARVGSPGSAEDVLDRSDREATLEDWLDQRGVDDPWQHASALANLGLAGAELDDLATRFPAVRLGPVLTWLSTITALHELLAEVAEGSARVAELVDALKSYAYMDRGADALPVDIHRGLDDTLVMLRGRLKDGVRVHKEYADDLPTVFARGGEINQVWTNLIDNALHALDGGGELIIRTRAADGRVEVDVEDTGPGIPAEAQSRIFDPFFTTKPVGDGTGMGLSVTHSIVVQGHGGAISVDSGPGRTVFTVSLPLASSSD